MELEENSQEIENSLTRFIHVGDEWMGCKQAQIKASGYVFVIEIFEY